MSADRMRLVEEVFLAAAAARGDAREAILIERCAGDPSLRSEVESLLEHDAGDEEAVLSAPPIARQLLPRNLMASEDRLKPGTRVGAYTIKGVLGSGGMGAVYVAEQESPRRTVALKLIRPGAASGALLRRMQQEAELLGRLKHPGIAQIFEAGRTDYGIGPQPFFAMEYVEGQTLDRHAHSGSLNARARLELVLKICEAVEHAHQKGVIHRDLKPSNILVERAGQPKILDFGVARATGGDRAQITQTGAGQLIGTLPYMSPEQVSGDPAEVDTRSDIYALGVILFQLLSGRLPLDLGSATLVDAARIIREEAPPRLSSINREFRGDIETIVSKALEKDRARRYQSAADLAEDIRRYLAGLPIRARDDSAMYILRKQLRRYQGVVAVASIGVIALSCLSAYVTYLARKEREARSQAVVAREAAEGQRRAADALRDKAEQQTERLRRSFYFNRIGFAQAARTSYDADRMRRLLDECPEDLRGWEWQYLDRHTDQSARSIVCRPASPGPAALSGDGSTLAVWGTSGEVKLFEVASGSAKGVSPTSFAPGAVTLDRDGQRLVAIGANGRAELRRVGAPTSQWDRRVLTSNLHAAMFTPDGHHIVVAGQDSSAVVLESDTGSVAARLPCGATGMCVTVSPNGAWIAVGTETGELRIFDSATFQPAATLPAHRSEVRDVAFSWDSGQLASCGNDGIVRVCVVDAGKWKLGAFFRVHDNKVAAVAFSRDNSRLASGGTETVIHIIRLSNGEVERSLGGHMQTVTELVYAPDGRTLISTARDGTAKWWDLTSPVEDPVATDLGRHLRAVMSPDGKTLVVSGENTRMRAFELPSLRPIESLSAPGGGSRTLAISPSSDLVGAGGSEEPFQIWDIKSGQLVRPLLHSPNPFWAAGFTSDDCVVFGGFGKPLYAFNPRTGDRRWETQLESDGAAALAVDHSHNRFAVATRLGRILIFDAATGLVTGRVEGHPTMGTASVAFFADGSRLVTGGHDHTARVWDLSTGKETHVLRGHKGAVMSVAVMPDQRRIITGSMDNTVRIWDATQAEEVLSLRHHVGGVILVGASNDGMAIISASDDGSVRVWDAAK